jgi:hypothetical protein
MGRRRQSRELAKNQVEVSDVKGKYEGKAEVRPAAMPPTSPNFA